MYYFKVFNNEWYKTTQTKILIFLVLMRHLILWDKKVKCVYNFKITDEKEMGKLKQEVKLSSENQ